ncbi:MAG: LysR family transcriptional regulator [Pseudomonadota bacterium]
MKKKNALSVRLDALRVFEAAGRNMNFSAAGRELLVSQAAVSRRIQDLEAALGVELFVRRGRTLSLTPKGRVLLRRVQVGLEFLIDGLDEVTNTSFNQTVSLAASGAISHIWLGRALQEYRFEHPETAIRVLTTDAMPELVSETNDLAIIYSRGQHPLWNLSRLLEEELVPVASPDYLARHELSVEDGPLSVDQIAKLDLFDYDRTGTYWLTLRDWFTTQGYESRPITPRVVFSNYPLTIETAVRGDGIV